MLRPLDRALILALLIPVFAVVPLAQHAGLPNLADGVIHLLRQVDFDHALRDGALVPRWGADLYLGFGYPLYVFAPPLLAYGVETLHLLGLAMDDALKLCVVLVLELYSLGMFLFMRPKVGAHGALVAAALNVYAPFRMRETLVTGGNYPQLLALALFPLILWAFDGIIRTRARHYVVAATLASAALVLSHLFHALVFALVGAGYVLLRLLAARAPRQGWLMALGAGVLALLLSAFFWLPLLAEQPLVRASAEAFGAASDYRQRFLTLARLLAPPLPLDFAETNVDVPLSLGWAQLAFALAAMVSLLAPKRARLEPSFFVVIALVSIFLQLPISAFVWARVSFLPIAEFPWRFMGLNAFALAALGGYSLSRVRGARPLMLVTAAAIVLVVAAAFPYLVVPRGFVQLGTPSAADVLAYEQSTGAAGLTTLSEYLPRTVQALPADRPAPLSQAKLDARALPADAVQSAQRSPRGERADLQLATPATVRFRTFDYAGWTAYVDGQVAPISTQRDGTIGVAVPAGMHRIELRFESTVWRSLGEGISLLALLVVVAVALVSTRTVPAEGHTDIERRTFVVLALALCVLLVFKIAVLDAQGGLCASRALQPIGTFDNQIELLGAQTDESTLTRGEDLHARFFWRATQPLEKNYHIIAQLIAADPSTGSGQVVAVAGDDKPHPGDPVVQGETPTTQLPTDKYLRDEHRITLPTDTAPGRYELRVGWYDPMTGKRLRLPNGETLFATMTIEVRP